MAEATPDPSQLFDDQVRAEVAAGRRYRRALEAQVQPLATSLDGRSFRFRAPVDAYLQAGGYVHLSWPGGSALGEIADLRLVTQGGPDVTGAIPGEGGEYRAQVRFSVVEGDGAILGAAGPFHDADLATADPALVAAFLDASRPSRAALPIGEVLMAPGVPAVLDAGGFDRHTFFCGQSGSGKSYSLGVLLEQILLETDLRIIVLDPNSDAVRMRQVRAGVATDTAARWEAVAARILIRGEGREGDERLRLRFLELDPRLQAAVAGLDPLADREEYAAFLDLKERAGDQATLEDLPRLLDGAEGALGLLGSRFRNLGLVGWPLWSGRPSDRGVLGDLDRDDWRCLVVDLGSIPSPDERTLAATAVLKRLWERRTDRRPVLIVIDEAHNVCPEQPSGALQAIATRLAVNIAAEGRKYGLYLLVATQRPQRVHQSVVSQCDNLVLMRMGSPADLTHLSELFSFVPAGVMARAGAFRLGEALTAGRAVSHPMLVRFGARITQEGGADVPATWAAPRG